MLMDASKMSEIIRMKKKKMLEADPELIGTSPTPDMNAQDVYDMQQKGRIEETLDTPPKINADDTNMNMADAGEATGDANMGRKERLRAYMDKEDLGY